LIDEASKQRAHQAIKSLLQLNPTVAHRLLSDERSPSSVEDVVVDQLQVGDVVLIRPGERIPADGCVVAGHSTVNQAAITGESLPAQKQPGDHLFGGSLNGEGSLQVRVAQTAEQSTLARISRLIEQAQSTPSPTERVIDHFARRYTPAVIALAVALAFLPPVFALIDPQWVGLTAAGGWWPFWKQWFLRALVMLIVACPCALVISTPITIVCGLHRASQRGVLVKGGEFLEQVGCLRWLALDKTGTVTQGKPRVVDVLPMGEHTESQVITLAAALEQHSEHPLATAILHEARRRDLPLPATDQFQTLRGFGARATLTGQPCTVGSPRYFEQQGWLSRSDLPLAAQEQPGTSVVAVARESTVIGLILLRDQPRADAAATLQSWRRMGIERLVMLTGDHRSAAEQIAQELGFDECQADLLPEDKINQVRQLARLQPALAMVGDGVNDAPALAAAPIGIALGSGASDVALETADVAILSPHLDRVTELMELSRRTRAILKQNIALAIGIKLTVMLLALLGQATMWMAVASDVGASLLVIFNGTRLLRFGCGTRKN
jgi:Cd2+/Zn2+-exporting ATPase